MLKNKVTKVTDRQGTPPKTPLLRPLRNHLFDTERIENGTTKRTLFSDHVKFEDGGSKTEADTNMVDDAKLGYPLEFDLYGFWFTLEKGMPRLEVNDVYNKGVFKWWTQKGLSPIA